MPQYASNLDGAVSQRGIELPPEKIAQLDAYCRLLWEWNEKLNLTRHTDYEKFVDRDLTDSLQLAELLAQNEQVLDVGTGGGVPGVVLAILRPDLRISLSESVGKKAKAVHDIVLRMGLPIPVYHARAEEVLEEFRVGALVARAVGPLWKLLYWLRESWGSFDRLLAVKGPRWVEERGEARHRGLMHGLEMRRAAAYRPPGADGESVILELRRNER